MSDKKEERINPLFRNTSKADVPVKAPQEKPTPPPSPPTPAPLQQLADTLPSAAVQHRRRGKVPFKEAYKQFTSFLDIELDRRFHELLAEQGVTKTELFNEAIADLLTKYEQ